MKRCPTCQKEFPDSMRFCQTDGTPLLDEVEQSTPPVDPFKTVVAPPTVAPTGVQNDPMKTMVMDSHSKDEDILQIPEVFDPMKTVVVSSDEVKKNVPPPSNPFNEPVVSAPEPPKFNEPSLSPPVFGDISSSSSNEPPKPIEPPKTFEPPKFDAPFSAPVNEPPKIEPPSSPFNEPPPKMDSPFSSPFNEPPKFDASPLPSEKSSNDSPFNQPLKEPVSSPFDAPPAYKEPTSFDTPPPIDNSPFNQPPTSFDAPVNEPFNQPQQNDWNQPSSAPVANWENQGTNMNNQFTPPPVGATGQNNTLAIVSLVLGILSFVCLGFLGSIPAIITGFMQKSKIKTNPMEFGGGGMATIGMVLGALNIVLTVVFLIIYVILIFANSR